MKYKLYLTRDANGLCSLWKKEPKDYSKLFQRYIDYKRSLENLCLNEVKKLFPIKRCPRRGSKQILEFDVEVKEPK